MDSHPEYVWQAPQYDISEPPVLENLMQLADDPQFPENFTRNAKWCPDGTAFLTQNEDRTFQSFTIPTPTSQLTAGDFPHAVTHPTKVFPQSDAILDFIWYPTASSNDPASFCFVASVRECPVKLLDASDGRLRASYRIVDHRERHVAPHSLAFNLSAQRLYCGFEDAIEVFDVSRPGEGTRIPTTPSRKSKDGLKGIISALAFAPSHESELYAAGSLIPTSSNVVMFSESQGSEPMMFVGGGPSLPVTQINFNPVRPHIMYVAYRRHGNIYSWDLRGDTNKPVKIFSCREPRGRTNQKIRFDVDSGGNWLSTGDQLGRISLFDLQDSVDAAGPNESSGSNPSDAATQIVQSALDFDAHQDAIGSVAFHPVRPTLLSASGSRHFEADSFSDLSDSSGTNDMDLSSANAESHSPPKRQFRRTQPHPITFDSSIKTWAFAGKEASFLAKD